MITNKTFSKAISSLLVVCMMSACTLSLSGCWLDDSYDEFDEDKEGIIDVRTKPAHEAYEVEDDATSDEEFSYYTLANNSRIKEATAFTGDEIEVFTASDECFNSYIDESTNAVLNKLKNVELTDEDGKDVEITPTVTKIFDEVSKLEHDIFKMELIKDGSEYFVYIELNVNWWSPCTLYYYNQDTSKLVELYTFDDEQVTALKIRDLSLI